MRPVQALVSKRVEPATTALAGQREPKRRWASARPHVCHVVVGLRLECQGSITGKVIGPLNLTLGVKVLVVVICALVSVIIGVGAGWLSYKPGTRRRDAVLYGAGAFVGSMTTCFMVLNSLGVFSGEPA